MCSHKYKVIETRHSNTETYRKKICKLCGDTIYTIEDTADETDDYFQKCWKKAGITRYARKKH